MNPDNNALARTYFIGGPPRVGKTILSYLLSEKIRGHVVSTDAIRNSAKKACSDKESDLFILNKMEEIPETDWISTHLDKPNIIIDYQNKESKAVWPSLISFCNSFCEDDAIHIVEGVGLIPSEIAKMKNKPEHIAFVGNTSSRHGDSMLRHATHFPERDWMGASNYSAERIAAMASFVKAMSTYFKDEAEKYKFPYYEIKDDDFPESIEEICSILIK
jgi:2-phosphoglycerate kinase